MLCWLASTPARNASDGSELARKFEDPIDLPDGRTLTTLHDAAQYITALPKAEHEPPNGRSRWKPSC